MDEKKVVVGVDGSVYRFHPHFHNLMTESIEKLVSKDIQVLILTIFNHRYNQLSGHIVLKW